MSRLLRLDKFLADMGNGTRSELREAAKRGRVQVNGVTEKRAERKINPDKDEVTLDGRTVRYSAFEYYMMNKPQGVISATEDPHQKTVLELLQAGTRRDLFPVGRLDKDTEGLLLLTNDGDLAHRLLTPGKHVEKQYLARISGQLPPDAAARFREGILLSDGTLTRPAELYVHDRWEQGAQVYLTVHEGKFHQVKRMFGALGCHVEALKRISMGPLCLDPELLPGQYRALTPAELECLNRNPEEAGPLADALRSCRAVIFDLDGTLADSMWMWHDIDVEYLERFGLACPPMLQRTIEGMSFSETAVYFKEEFGIPDSLDEIKRAWIAMSLEKYQNEVPLKPGARDFLYWLRAHGIRLGIATSNGSDMVHALLDAQGIGAWFDCVATACEVEHGKPAPDIYLKVAENLGVLPEDCLVFEDIPAGIRSGKSAGMRVCAVEDEHSAWLRAEKISLSDFYIRDYRTLMDECCRTDGIPKQDFRPEKQNTREAGPAVSEGKETASS